MGNASRIRRLQTCVSVVARKCATRSGRSWVTHLRTTCSSALWRFPVGRHLAYITSYALNFITALDVRRIVKLYSHCVLYTFTLLCCVTPLFVFLCYGFRSKQPSMILFKKNRCTLSIAKPTTFTSKQWCLR